MGVVGLLTGARFSQVISASRQQARGTRRHDPEAPPVLPAARPAAGLRTGRAERSFTMLAWPWCDAAAAACTEMASLH